MVEVNFRFLRPLAFRYCVDVVLRCQVGRLIVRFFERYKFFDVRNVRRGFRLRFRAVVIKRHRRRVNGAGTMYLARPASATGRDCVSVNCGVGLLAALHPGVIVLHRRRRIATIRLVLPGRGHVPSSLVVGVHPFVKATSRGHFIRAYLAMAVVGGLGRLAAEGRPSVQGPFRASEERDRGVFHKCMTTRFYHVPGGPQVVRLASRLDRLHLVCFRTVPTWLVNQGEQALLFSCQEGLHHVPCRRRATAYSNVCVLGRIIRRAPYAGSYPHRSIVDSRQHLVRGGRDVLVRIVVREGIVRIV